MQFMQGLLLKENQVTRPVISINLGTIYSYISVIKNSKVEIINGQPRVKVDIYNKEKTFTLEEISAIVLGKIKEVAESYLAATKDAGIIAGLNVLYIVNKPTIVALAYGLDKTNKDKHFNNYIINYFAKKYNREKNVNIIKDPKIIGKLKRKKTAKIKIKSFYIGKDFPKTLTRANNINDIILAILKEFFSKKAYKDAKGLILIDINPLTLGIKTTGGVITHLIKRGTTIPTKKILTQVYKGKRLITKDNNLLVIFKLDANSILRVSAGDKGTSKSKFITITNDKRRLSAKEIKRMVKEAKKYTKEDKATRKRIKAKNGLKNYAYSLKNQVNNKEGLSTYPITSKLYSGGAGGMPNYSDEEPSGYNEL
ncbi:heat shock protein 70kD, peptide-binding domain-containing protein [Cenococcum geophilum]